MHKGHLGSQAVIIAKKNRFAYYGNTMYDANSSKELGTANPSGAVINRLASDSESGFFTSGASNYDGPDEETERFTVASADLQTRPGCHPSLQRRAAVTQTVTEAIITMTTVTTGTTTAELSLVPVFTGTLQGQSVQLCEARTLHTFMGVLRDFTTWIKARIRKFGFVEGVDFLIVKLDSPDLGNQVHGGDRKSIDYHLTLDMAKELSMVENNDKGRIARRYFIDCEKQVISQLSTNPLQLTTTIIPAQAQQLRELVQLVVESGKQGFGETWNRLHRKMKVNSYLNLRPDQFDEAVNYLRGKMDDQSMATLLQKHYPKAVAALTHDNAPQSVLPALDVNTLTGAIRGGLLDHRAVVAIATAANMRAHVLACGNRNRGYGREVADKLDSLGWADLHAINVAASMEVWKRTMQLEEPQ